MQAFANIFKGGGTYGKGRRTLSAETCAIIDKRWSAIVQPATGYSSYQQLYEGIRGRSFPFKTTARL